MSDVVSTSQTAVTGTDDAPVGLRSRILRAQGLQILVILAVIVAFFSILQPDAFLTVSNLRGIVVNTSILAVLGVGMTMVIITGGIDLSVGSVLVFSGVIADKTMKAFGGQGWGVAAIGLLVACLCGLGWGLLNGVIVAKGKVPPLITTLGTLGMALGFSQIITTGIDLRDVPDVLVDNIGFGNIIGEVPTLSVISLVVILLGYVLLHRTRFGLHTFAVGSNIEGSRRVGIKVDQHLIKVYALSGLMAGFAGMMNLSFFQSTTISGQSNTNLNVIAGVVIGGTSLFGGLGTIFGTVIGLLIPSTLQNGFVIIGVQSFWQQVVVGAVLIAAVFIDQRRRTRALGGHASRTHPLLRLRRGTPKGEEQ